MNEKQCAGCGECKCGETVAKAVEARPSGWSELLFRATVADLLHVLTPYLQIRLPMPEADHDIACRAIDKLSFMLDSDAAPPADADRAEALRLADALEQFNDSGAYRGFGEDVNAAAALLRRLAAAPAVPAAGADASNATAWQALTREQILREIDAYGEHPFVVTDSAVTLINRLRATDAARIAAPEAENARLHTLLRDARDALAPYAEFLDARRTIKNQAAQVLERIERELDA